jgi:hypothetical protein
MNLAKPLLPAAVAALMTLLVPPQVGGQQDPASDGAAAGRARGKAKAGAGAGFDLSQLIGRLDANQDGKVTLDEVPEDRRPMVERLMQRLDANGDKALTRDELANARGPSQGGQKSPPAPPKAEASTTPANATTAVPAAGTALLPALDKNGDGTLAPEEIAVAVAALQALDKNGDGRLSPEELLAAPPKAAGAAGAGGAMVVAFIKKLDKNEDGKLGRDEAPKRFQENFDEFDENMDEALDSQELAKALAQFRKNQ